MTSAIGRRVSVPVAVVCWAADECARQRSGETSVAWMVTGWSYAMRNRSRRPTLRDVLALGRIVEPRKALDGLRTCGVRVGWDVKMPPEQVPGALDRLLAVVPDPAERHRAGHPADCDEWYRQYEEVHPFADGNGRTGSILWNWLRGTLPDPQVPPNYWADGTWRPRTAGELVRDSDGAGGDPIDFLRRGGHVT